MSQRASKKKVDLGFTSERFPVGTHMCLIFNDDHEVRDIISRYLEAGRRAGECLGYFADVATPAEVRSHLENRGVDCAVWEQNAFVMAPALASYCPQGAFDPDHVLAFLERQHRLVLDSEWNGCRMTGEMSWALQNPPGVERLFEYESRINSLVKAHPLTVICQYDSRLFSGEAIFAAMKVHPLMILNGQVVRNPFYTPWEAFRLEEFSRIPLHARAFQ